MTCRTRLARVSLAIAIAFGPVAFGAAIPIAAAAGPDEVIEIPTRPGVTVKFVLRGDRSGNPPIAILFSGGDGIIDLDSWDGRGNPAGNFLVRTRKHWVKPRLLVAVPDAPSDRKGGNGLINRRDSAGHAADIRAVIAHMRKYTQGPVFLIGTSRGTLSAAGLATHLGPGEIAGIVLTATVTRHNRGGDKSTIQDIALGKVRVPVLFVHQKDDACDVTVFEDLPAIAKRFTGAPSVEIRGYDPGSGYRGSVCGSRSAHGFRGNEKQVVKETAAWIHRVAGTGKK